MSLVEREILAQKKIQLIGLKGNLRNSIINLAQRKEDCAECAKKYFKYTYTTSGGMSCHMAADNQCGMSDRGGSSGQLIKMIRKIPILRSRIVSAEMSIASIEIKISIWVAEQKALQETFLADAMEQQVAQETAKAEQERIKIAQTTN